MREGNRLFCSNLRFNFKVQIIGTQLYYILKLQAVIAVSYTHLDVYKRQTYDNCRTFKQNQIMFCMRASIVETSRSVDFGEDRLMERGSLPATFYVVSRQMYS